MILGVALVVDELHKGQRLVFRYPEARPASLLPGTSTGLSKLYSQYFSISQDNFAKLFRPKNTLLNKVLELTIDDLHFISFPCPCTAAAVSDATLSTNNTTGQQSGDVSIADTQSMGSGVLGSSGYTLSMFNIVVVSVTAKAMRKINPNLLFKCQHRGVASAGSDPIAAAHALRDRPYGVCTASLKRVVEAMAEALCNEERRCHYLTREVSAILQLIDLASKKTKKKATAATCNSSTASAGDSGTTSPMRTPQIATPTLHSASSLSEPPPAPAILSAATSREFGGDGEERGTDADAGDGPGADISATMEAAQDGAPSTIYGVVSFERTARSVSNASAISVGSAYSVSSGTELSVATGGAAGDPGNVAHSPPPTPTNEYMAADTLPLSAVTVSASNVSSLGNTPVVPRSPVGGTGGFAESSLPVVSRDRAGSTASSGQIAPSPEPYQQQQQAIPTMKSTVSHASLAMAEHDGTASSSSSGSDSGHGHWGIHLLPAVLLQSNLANELRLVFHSLAGGQSVLVNFNGGGCPEERQSLLQSEPVLLQCADVRLCADCAAGAAVNRPGGLQSSSSVVSLQNYGSVALGSSYGSATSSGSSGLNGMYGSSSNSTSRPRGSFTGGVAAGGGLHEYARLRGVDLETQTVLGMAGADSVLHLLGSLLLSSSNRSTSESSSGDGEEERTVDDDEGSRLLGAEEGRRLCAFLDAACDPTATIFDLCVALNEPVEELLTMASWLRGVGLMEPVPILYNHTVFRLHSDAPTEDTARVARAFESFLAGLLAEDRLAQLSRGSVGLRKSQSYSHNNGGGGNRVRADSDGNVPHSSGSRSNPSLHQASAAAVSDGDTPPTTARGRPPAAAARTILNAEGEQPTPANNDSDGGHSAAGVLNLDTLGRLPARYGLQQVLTLFDGRRTVKQVVASLEPPLQRHGVAVVVFLLRWHMLCEVRTHIFNLARMAPAFTVPLPAVSVPATGTTQQHSGGPLDVFGGGGGRNSFLQVSEECARSVRRLSSRERQVYEKVAPYVVNVPLSTRTVSEIVHTAQISETELLRVVGKLPFLKLLS